MNQKWKHKARSEKTLWLLIKRGPVEKDTPGFHVISDTNDDTVEKALELEQRGITCALSPEIYALYKPEQNPMRRTED